MSTGGAWMKGLWMTVDCMSFFNYLAIPCTLALLGASYQELTNEIPSQVWLQKGTQVSLLWARSNSAHMTD